MRSKTLHAHGQQCAVQCANLGLPLLPFGLDLVPNLCHCAAAGKYLEIFGRKNNLHNYWVTVGNEVTGTGLPTEDEAALKANRSIPGAVYGARN